MNTAPDLTQLIRVLDDEIERVTELREEYVHVPMGTVTILAVIAPALNDAAAARRSNDAAELIAALNKLRGIE